MHSYDGRCSHLSRDDVQQRKRAGHQYTVRFKVGSELRAQYLTTLDIYEERALARGPHLRPGQAHGTPGRFHHLEV